MVKILSGDPGKIRDSFFRVGTEVKDKKIYIRLAKRNLGRAYKDMCAEFAEDSRKFGFDYNVIEYNNTGVFVVEELQTEYNLPVIPITTINMGREMKKKVSAKSMDKYEIIHWALSHLDSIIFPPDDICTKDMMELKRQWSIFAEHRTEAGNVAYYAPGSEHDDGPMALLLNLHLARNFLDDTKSKRPSARITSKRVTYGDTEDLFGSGAPEGATVHSRQMINPG